MSNNARPLSWLTATYKILSHFLGENPERIMEPFTRRPAPSFQLIYLVTRGIHFANPCLLRLFYIGHRASGKARARPRNVGYPDFAARGTGRRMAGARRAFQHDAWPERITVVASEKAIGDMEHSPRRKNKCNVLTMRARQD
jgi:hypothetical protein